MNVYPVEREDRHHEKHVSMGRENFNIAQHT